jgi:diguanylate cyclase (GGDEF)-like protein
MTLPITVGSPQTAPDAFAPLGAEALLAVHGPLAAAMERLVGLAATALRVPFAVIILTGEDRRCFGAGPALPDWASRDSGALWRSGIADLISHGPVEWRDTARDLPAPQGAAAAQLGIRSLLGVPIRSASGAVLGVFCGADPQPVTWNEDDLEMLEQFAATAAADWDLRHSLARHEANEKWIGYSTSHDLLTGLANRAVLLERLRIALARKPARDAQAADAGEADEGRREDLVAVFFLDLNDFRLVNEEFGHRVGDRLLASIGHRLRQTAGPQATVARLGGDEFAVLIERIEAPEIAVEMAKRFRTILALPTRIGDEDISLTVSVGIAMSTPASELPEHMLRGADLAMARAKRSSRGDEAPEPVVFDWKLAAEARARRRLGDELRQAVDGDEFVLHYMPIISLTTGRIAGAEALLRWNHPVRGLLAPFEFLSVAEELDVILDVGRWVLAEACRQLSEWNAGVPAGARLTIAVNLSTRQFHESGFLNDLARTVKRFGLAPSSLVLEVNERVVAQDVARAAGVLTGLRALGARIHMDDFGSGNSPLGYLQQLPLDGVKIDHVLVRRMDRDEPAMRLVRSVVSLARELDLDVVAEGMSSTSHLKVLQGLGCTHGQGQLFSPAVQASGITAMLRDRPW